MFFYGRVSKAVWLPLTYDGIPDKIEDLHLLLCLFVVVFYFCQKIFFSDAIKGHKADSFYINLCDIIHYRNGVFYCCFACGFVAVAT